MRSEMFCNALAGLVALLVLVPGLATAQGAKADKSIQKTFDRLLEAIKGKDRDAFVANATDAVKEGTSQETMDAFDKNLGSRLKKGFQATYLCELNIMEYKIYLWKMTFTDGGDDMVIRLAFKDGKLAGFFLQ